MRPRKMTSNYNATTSSADNSHTLSQRENNLDTANETDSLLIHTASSTDNRNPTKKLIHYVQFGHNFLIHLLLCGFTAFVTFICFAKGMVLFSWHPTLMLFGFFILMTEAILCFSKKNLLTITLSHQNRISLHWILQAIAACSITAAFVIIYFNKIYLGKSHFTSNHGIIGLTTVVCTGTSLLLGILARYSFKLRHYIRPVLAKLSHSLLAICCYILACTCIILGLFSPWFLENVSYTEVYYLMGLVIFVLLSTISSPLFASLSKIRNFVCK